MKKKPNIKFKKLSKPKAKPIVKHHPIVRVTKAILVNLWTKVGIVGLIALVTAYYKLPANLTIVNVEKGLYNFDSRIVIKNIGILSAYNIQTDSEKINAKIGPFIFKNSAGYNNGAVARELKSDEEMKATACSNVIGAPPGTSLGKCNYILLLNYDADYIFYTKAITKKWRIELRNAAKGYDWLYTPIS